MFASAEHELTSKDEERHKAWEQHNAMMNAIVEEYAFHRQCWLLTVDALDYNVNRSGP